MPRITRSRDREDTAARPTIRNTPRSGFRIATAELKGWAAVIRATAVLIGTFGVCVSGVLTSTVTAITTLMR